MSTRRKVAVAGTAFAGSWLLIRAGAFYGLTKLAALVAAQEAAAEAGARGEIRLDDAVIVLSEEIAPA